MKRIEIENRDELSLTRAEDDEIAGLLSAAFGQNGDDDFGGRSFYKQRHHLRVLGRSDGRLIGHIAICFRVINVAGTLVPVTGLAEVATHPDHGGQGIAGQLLKHTIALLRQTQAAFVLLFGDHPVYARNGFRAVTNTLRYTKIEDSRTESVVSAPTRYLQVLPLTDQAWDDQADVDLLGHLF
ncbi:GNAT family N-acetyltransferase [Yoonia litorea]|uniref:Predicted N-acetyltransferase YhbS n=1 Tax=Yoonia litorea TaxID=1123755 RepID=A0A1I6MU08_9RHOB|nr:GNAT family N-acetyltransferase [Yoonia litorea]SFS19121.1 Predicted N-acetyltransferase YhbS [Yoonia litorea]